jgi:hypothetical protein
MTTVKQEKQGMIKFSSNSKLHTKHINKCAKHKQAKADWKIEILTIHDEFQSM